MPLSYCRHARRCKFPIQPFSFLLFSSFVFFFALFFYFYFIIFFSSLFSLPLSSSNTNLSSANQVGLKRGTFVERSMVRLVENLQKSKGKFARALRLSYNWNGRLMRSEKKKIHILLNNNAITINHITITRAAWQIY